MSIFIVCKQAHQLISEGLDRPLRASERAQLKMHLAICRACTGFNGQMSFLRKAMQQTAREGLPAQNNQQRGKHEDNP
ncbi:zf-HC2 domain-containing protein [Undibacterium sp. TS12]|uniref:zf-HC2 domain-containing protein n=1 Tax=Undibacterium sp. TS12 TaxID=2908202 RepID=UPI001F4C8F41|nr:zf-HC2 domain-containing protein [Undibacterium sp. TS12]MCH8621130.1 zf-HC2 domain-containing protein [Undibacterium sp. TS12]